MMHCIFRSLGAVLVCVTIASAAAAETIYKYRGADGRTIYSNRPIPGLDLIESLEHTSPPPAPASAPGDAAKRDAAAEKRITERLAVLDKAWAEVQEATRVLAAAEARLAEGATPQEQEGRSLVGPANPPPPESGGPTAPATPATGGPSGAASPAVGGPMGSRRGGGQQPEYRDRMIALEADVQAARKRLDAAWRRYNELR